MLTFGEYVREKIRETGYGSRRFAHDMDMATGRMSEFLTGKRHPPAEEVLDRWAGALKLSSSESELLKDLAALARSPERIQRKYCRLVLLTTCRN